ncbi:MAG: hypothetical protein LBU37_10635 [Tannerellaceae bacterium]|jgi:hypothetical protein|nr:hypothetical protein [Tannerellaceae bacterium]
MKTFSEIKEELNEQGYELTYNGVVVCILKRDEYLRGDFSNLLVTSKATCKTQDEAANEAYDLLIAHLKKGRSKYYIDYIYNNKTGSNFYHQLVRRSDAAILYANPNLEYVFAYCFKSGICKGEVMIL